MEFTPDYVLCVLAGMIPAALAWVIDRQRLANRLARAEALVQSGAKALSEVQASQQQVTAQLMQAREAQARAEAEVAHLRQHIAEGAAQSESLKQAFERLSRETLDQQATQLAAAQQERLAQVLSPLRDRIREFEQKVEATYQTEARERFALKKEIDNLVQLNVQMGEEARNLTRALKGDAKAQGNWGELILKRVLELSGLREGAEYTTQARDMGLRDAEGRALQPDVVLHLPGGKHLIVDAKVSLTAYERYVGAEDEYNRNQQLRLHLESVRSHIQQLSAKNYPQLEGLQSPEFVFLFLAVEPAFSLAVQHEPGLFAFAWERRILLVSPGTLLATLKTVASVWSLERQNQNAREIARQGGALYDKLAATVEDFQKVGLALERVLETHHVAMRKLHTGKGNLLARAERLRGLGAPATRELPLAEEVESLLPSGDEEAEEG